MYIMCMGIGIGVGIGVGIGKGVIFRVARYGYTRNATMFFAVRFLLVSISYSRRRNSPC